MNLIGNSMKTMDQKYLEYTYDMCVEKSILYLISSILIAALALVVTILMSKAFLSWFSWYDYEHHKWVLFLNFVFLRCIIRNKNQA